MNASWRVIPAAPLFREYPGLLQKTLGQRAILGFPEQQAALVVLRMPRRWAALDGQRFPAERVGSSNAWVVAAQATPGELSAWVEWEDGWPELRWGEHCLGGGCHARARDWAWAWRRTCGPVILRVFVQRSAAEIEHWVERQCPGVWRDGLSRWSSDCRLRAAPGCLTLSRGYLLPPDEQVDCDYFLLMSLAEGGLGELEFDLFDGDYYWFMASGDSCASLRDYLHARAGAGRPHRWNRFREVPTIDAVASDRDNTAARIAAALGWESTNLDTLLQHLAATPVRDLPRHVCIQIWKGLGGESFWDLFLRAQPRVMFRWQEEELRSCESR